MIPTLPDTVTKYFWGDNLDDLRWPEHKAYVSGVLLDRGDRESLHWLFSRVAKEEIRSMLPSLRMRDKSRNFWNIYLS